PVIQEYVSRVIRVGQAGRQVGGFADVGNIAAVVTDRSRVDDSGRVTEEGRVGQRDRLYRRQGAVFQRLQPRPPAPPRSGSGRGTTFSSPGRQNRGAQLAKPGGDRHGQFLLVRAGQLWAGQGALHCTPLTNRGADGPMGSSSVLRIVLDGKRASLSAGIW